MISTDENHLIALGRRTPPWRIRLARLRLGAEMRADLYETLGFYLSLNLRLTDALIALWEVETKSGTERLTTPLAILLPRLIARMADKGERWDQAMSFWVPPSEALLLAALSEGGITSSTLSELATTLRRQQGWRGVLLQGALPILGTLGMLVLTVYGAALYFFPKLLAAAPKLKLVGSAKALHSFSLFFVDYGPLLLLLAAGLVSLGVWSLPRWTGSARKLADRLPLFSLYKVASGVSFLMALAPLLRARRRLPEALATLSRIASPYVAERLRGILSHDGLRLGEAMAATGFAWPDEVTIRQITHVISGDRPDRALHALAERRLDRLARHIQSLAQIVSLVGMLAMVGLIIWFLFVTQDIATSAQSLRR